MNEIGGELAIILLAAGSSSRMGQSKQLLLVDTDPLLLRSVKTAVNSSANNVIVVLGAEAEKHKSIIENQPVQIVNNNHWQTGMGSSIKGGLNHLLKLKPNTSAVIISVCDQPLLHADHFNELIETYNRSKKNIIASYYSNSPGVPALFDKKLFNELLQIPDDQGAKKLFHKHQESLLTIDFPDGKIDLDTWEEYQNFKNQLSNNPEIPLS